MRVVVGPERVGHISDPNVSPEGNLHSIAPQVKFTSAEFRGEGGGKDHNPAILDLHLPNLGKLFEMVQVFQVLLMLSRGASKCVQTLLECEEPPGLSRDPPGILLEVLLGKAHLLFQEGRLFLEATSTLAEIGLPDSGLPLSAPRGFSLFCLVPQRLQGVLERFQTEWRERSEFFEDPREAQVEEAPEEEKPELFLLLEEVKEAIDVCVDNFTDGSPFVVCEHLSSADLEAGGEGLLGGRRDGIPEREGESGLWNARPDPEQDGRGRKGEVMKDDAYSAKRP